MNSHRFICVFHGTKIDSNYFRFLVYFAECLHPTNQTINCWFDYDNPPDRSVLLVSLTATNLVHVDEYLYVSNILNAYVTPVSKLAAPYEYDTLTIQGKQYKNVSYFRYEFDGDTSEQKRGCYYNLEYGVLRMELGDSVFMDLVKKE